MKKLVSFIAGVLARFTAMVVILGAAFVFGAGLITVRSQERLLDERPAPVSVMRVVEQDKYVATRRFAGRLVAGQVSDVSFELGGLVTEVIVDDGDQVSAGDTLARLDETQLRNRKDELEGQRAEAASQLTRAENTLTRTEQLRAQGFATESDLDTARADRDGLRGRLRQIDAALAGVAEDLKDATLVAPFGGEVVRRYVDKGAVVQAGQGVVRINEDGVLEARVGVPLNYRNRISVGDVYSVSAGALESTGLVTNIVSNVNEGTRTLTVILEIQDDPGFIPRDLVRLALTDEVRETGIWVPAKALNESIRGLWSVYVVTPDGDNLKTGVVGRKDVEIIHIEEARIFVREPWRRVTLSSPPGRFVLFPVKR
ncbi:MAG: efflux RND transporter periplasmic adaptor subunit [Pseudomonadota bacterium]